MNPLLGYDASFFDSSRRHRSKASGTVAVAGGGTAGITAAVRAAELGYAVRLFEQKNRLGGLLNTARAEPFKQEICGYLEYLLDQLAGTGVEVVLETPVEYDLVQRERPDILIDATGSQPVMPDIPPDLAYRVLSVRDLLLDVDEYRSSRRAVILGGGSSGCEAALVLRGCGVQVTVIEQASRILQDLEPVSALSLRRLLAQTDIAIHTDTRFLRLEPDGVITDRQDRPTTGDLVVVALGGRSNSTLKSCLDSDHWRYGANYLPVGDAHRVGRIYEAVHDSYWRASSLLDTMRPQ